MSTTVKLLVQCDFDNTVTVDDISFMLLDAFAEGDWHPYLEQYKRREITVSQFNSRAFGLVRADERTMLDYLLTDNRLQVRPGFEDLVQHCRQHGIKFAVVSNGLKFYIRAILRKIGMDDIEVFAAESEFNHAGARVWFIGPDGNELGACFKEAYTRHFLGRGYRVAYIGDGSSDCSPASEANYVFARDSLLAYCREHRLNCTPFNDFYDVIRGLEGIS
jgi:2-hydroxy-3-keto-5-methylthiopentenyl-1-phosphate phosphatase